MKYSKFNDPAALLLSLCLPFDEEENAALLSKSVEFKKNEPYKQAYITVLKRFYLDNFSDIWNGRYVLRPFKELDKEFETDLRDNVSRSVPLLPEYMVETPTESEQNKSERIRKMLEKIKGRVP